MRAGRDGMQDVEIVDIDDLALPDAGAPEEPEAAYRAARARRAQVLRLLRRWWPVPLVLVLAVVGVQVVQDAREDAAVERRRQVKGVLPEIDRDLQARPIEDEPELWSQVVAMHVGGLTITVPPVDSGEARSVRAVRGDEQVWTTSLENGSDRGGAGGYAGTSCGLDRSETRVVCVVDDLGQATGTEESGTQGEVVASRLVVLDVPSGDVLDRRVLPTGSLTLLDGDRTYTTSVADGVLTVSARDAVTGAAGWQTDLAVEGVTARQDAAVTWPQVAGDHLLVSTGQQTWAFGLADGTLVASSRLGITVGRSGTLIETGSGLRRAEDGTLLTDQGSFLVGPGVDDGSLPDLELVVRSSGSTAQTLSAVSAADGDTAWSADLDGWDGYSVIVLDGIVYAAGLTEVWAIDLATGTQVWTARREQGMDGTLLTDGRYLFTVESSAEAMAVTAEDGAQDGTEVRPPVSDGLGARLVGFRLSDGARGWEAPLPDGVDAVSGYLGVLIGYSRQGDGASVVLG